MRSSKSRGTRAPVIASAASNDLFGPPPLIAGEDVAAYNALFLRVSSAVKPSDIFEEIWIRDIVDLVWEIIRYRRLKAGLLAFEASTAVDKFLERTFISRRFSVTDDRGDLVKQWAQGEPSARAVVKKQLDAAGLTIDAVMAKTLAENLEAIERLDYMIASAEARKNIALREIERHRLSFGTSLKRAAQEAEDAEFEEADPSQLGVAAE